MLKFQVKAISDPHPSPQQLSATCEILIGRRSENFRRQVLRFTKYLMAAKFVKPDSSAILFLAKNVGELAKSFGRAREPKETNQW